MIFWIVQAACVYFFFGWATSLTTNKVRDIFIWPRHLWNGTPRRW